MTALAEEIGDTIAVAMCPYPPVKRLALALENIDLSGGFVVASELHKLCGLRVVRDLAKIVASEKESSLKGNYD